MQHFHSMPMHSRPHFYRLRQRRRRNAAALWRGVCILQNVLACQLWTGRAFTCLHLDASDVCWSVIRSPLDAHLCMWLHPCAERQACSLGRPPRCGSWQ